MEGQDGVGDGDGGYPVLAACDRRLQHLDTLHPLGLLPIAVLPGDIGRRRAGT
jgi:hypothetical protein